MAGVEKLESCRPISCTCYGFSAATGKAQNILLSQAQCSLVSASVPRASCVSIRAQFCPRSFSSGTGMHTVHHHSPTQASHLSLHPSHCCSPHVGLSSMGTSVLFLGQSEIWCCVQLVVFNALLLEWRSHGTGQQVFVGNWA